MTAIANPSIRRGAASRWRAAEALEWKGRRMRHQMCLLQLRRSGGGRQPRAILLSAKHSVCAGHVGTSGRRNEGAKQAMSLIGSWPLMQWPISAAPSTVEVGRHDSARWPQGIGVTSS
ncbi:Hypothetical protein R9X50_00532000 [Acrodontium crateriforme]|uniref:Uncharacterized protein n=1 Tax=Acrodontium crateriforme TaxID=150365 RepID=A0AAQ3M9D2_9PEZI|nr:Hypothetical protein R9X50_00532000 [Acrodontium crateriforme]